MICACRQVQRACWRARARDAEDDASIQVASRSRRFQRRVRRAALKKLL